MVGTYAFAEKTQLYYRGSLKSCNYSCAYCPFSKKRSTRTQRQKDVEELFRFTSYLEEKKVQNCAVQIVPYGEVLLIAHYWEAMARLSRQEGIEAVGCQTNLSFALEGVDDKLWYYKSFHGNVEKLRLWCTFHPSMTSLGDFLSQCKRLSAYRVPYCVGAVGNPDNLNLLRKLRKELPDSVYLWINKMDGLKRAYTKEEIEAFSKIDNCFSLELAHKKADISHCRKSLFVEADGTVSFCNIGKNSMCMESLDTACREIKEKKEIPLANFYDMDLSEYKEGDYTCKRKECSCYLSYCNRTDIDGLSCFQPYPAFRIPMNQEVQKG